MLPHSSRNAPENSQSNGNISETHLTTRSRRRSEGRNWTTEEYANLVLSYSTQAVSDSLHPGYHYWNLANYLRSPFESHARDALRRSPLLSSSGGKAYVILHRLIENQSHAQNLEKPEDLESIELSELTDGKEGQVLFMNGHPSATWLATIGAKYRVDPEFFLRHLDFRAVVSRPNHFALPCLPSAAENLMRLRFTTIGYQRRTTPEADQNAVEKMRKESLNEMNRYAEALESEAGWDVGDSLVRNFSVHDEEHCSIEQDISICVNKQGQGWTSLVWSDCGNDLGSSVRGPWIDQIYDGKQWLPTMQCRPKVAFGRNLLPSEGHGTRSAHENQKIFQSASLLPRGYGRRLDSDVGLSNPFYALTELFAFAASSELQFLNLLETKIALELAHSKLVDQQSPTLSNLLYSQQILERHIDRISENISTIKSRGGTRQSPHVPQSHKDKADAAAEMLLTDFQHLLGCAKDMSKRCEKGMTIIMNNAMIRESQRAIQQAAGVAKLTKLAFFFIPLSFTSSFFGMNFQQLGTGSQSIWVYFALSVPVVLVSGILMKISLRQMLQDVSDAFKKLKRNKFHRPRLRQRIRRLTDDLEGKLSPGTAS